MTVWNVFHVLLGHTFVSGLRTKKTKIIFLNLGFLQSWPQRLRPQPEGSPVRHIVECRRMLVVIKRVGNLNVPF